ncbi:MAG: sugar transferase [Clostridiales bacterium]|nr:sugar transferase [Clostridiales bacterium]
MILDLVCLVISVCAVYYIHIGRRDIWSTQTYRSLIILGALVHICVSVFDSNYKNILRRGYLKELIAVIKHTALVLAVLLILMFFLETQEDLSRMVIVYTAVISLCLTWAERTIWKKYIHHCLKKKSRLLLLVSDQAGAKRILKKFENHMLDFQVKGIVLIGEEKNGIEEISGVPVVAQTDNLIDYLLKTAVDEVLFSVPQNIQMPSDLIRECSLTGITVHLEIGFSDGLSGARYEEFIAGLTVMTSYLKLITAEQAFLKRLMDIIGGIVGLILTGILFVFVAPAIYISDPGPVFFIQERVGKNGRTFKLYKFRSMYVDAEERKAGLMEKKEMRGQMFKMKNDPRIIGSGPDGTRHGLGYFIRLTSIDELPQFWNVLKGDRGIIGTTKKTLIFQGFVQA